MQQAGEAITSPAPPAISASGPIEILRGTTEAISALLLIVDQWFG
jgi:hypothetical protein